MIYSESDSFLEFIFYDILKEIRIAYQKSIPRLKAIESVQ